MRASYGSERDPGPFYRDTTPRDERYSELAGAMDAFVVQASALWRKMLPDIDPPNLQSIIDDMKEDIE